LISYEDEYVSNKGLYLDKETRAMKANIDSKYFDDDKLQNTTNDIVESFTSNNQPNTVNNQPNTVNNQPNTVNNKLNKVLLKGMDHKLMIGSFSCLVVLIVILIIIYLKQN
jgi:hypothetical protein